MIIREKERRSNAPKSTSVWAATVQALGKEERRNLWLVYFFRLYVG